MAEMDQVYNQIVSIARDEGASKVILFGSRARGTNLPKSDIDIAVAGCGCGPTFNSLYDRLQNEVWSLLSIDVINLDADISDELINEIKRDGKTLYEEV